ncbi:neutral/alkaline non-lysosomal ceramidase N-terminal domain-containing protein [Verrucomicrobiales bacterium]|nr:neutral/alkaline non-lysosomal ceramidase N-terminal domain-containing protein [Verrucomicrobiales bacterium]MDB4662294.1 neutral/alkaline non-lysosomal ceramidase N-terminal domain-containing protein [Verrucomicrobiales bacterium]
MDRTQTTKHKKLPIALALVLSVISFSPLQAQEPRTQFRAGAATSNITLPLGARNGGVIARGGAAKNIHDELHARCLVLDDGKTKVAIVVCDLRMIIRDVTDAAKKLAEEATGIPAENILISATHTHGSPGVIGMHTDEIDLWYSDFLIKRMADGIQRANENLAPAKVGWGSGSSPNQVFNRRWFMKEGAIKPNPFGEEGEIIRTNPSRMSKLLDKPAGPVDPEVSILSVQHSDGRPLALIANYGVHYIGGYKGGSVSSDYFGVFASQVESLLATDSNDPPFVAMMSNGTSGDTNNVNFQSPKSPSKPWEKMTAVAKELADEVHRVYKTIEHRDDLSLSAATTELELGVRKPDAKRIAWAEKMMTPKADDTAVKINPRHVIYAQEALELAKFPATVSIQLQAIRIGDIGITGIPCEVFAETGLALKKESPLKNSFTIELANGYNGYLPTAQDHEWGGYETWPARSSYLETEAETKIRSASLELLKKVAAE